MNEPIEIMHIDPDYHITYFVISKGRFRPFFRSD